MGEEEVLDLDNLAALGPKVKIGSEVFSVRMPNRLGLQKTAEAQSLGKRLSELGLRMEDFADTSDFSEGTDGWKVLQETRDAFKDFITIIIPEMPNEVQETLSDEQQMAIMDFFANEVGRSRRSLQETLAPTSPKSPSTTELATQSS
ncbi:hypothetical protein LCGC14_0648080 [marine sediment metagenome]|uniref:Uncharacterized protein n=1 Tax=marine sediment metagenome TaxID=412755 RepID=A0A0F9QX67_9ZZZZ